MNNNNNYYYMYYGTTTTTTTAAAITTTFCSISLASKTTSNSPLSELWLNWYEEGHSRNAAKMLQKKTTLKGGHNETLVRYAQCNNNNNNDTNNM